MQIILATKGGCSAKINYFDYSTQKVSTLYVCSRVDPILEGNNWAEKEYLEDKTLFIIYGLGLGYHISSLAQRLNLNQKIIVVDTCTELYGEIKKHDNKWFENLQCHPQVECKISNQMGDLLEIFNQLGNQNTSFSIYQPMIKLIPENLYQVREVLDDYRGSILSIDKVGADILENCKCNETHGYQSLEGFEKTYVDKPIVVVSAGPSLDGALDTLKEIQEGVYVFSTGRALRALINKNIRVDLFCIIDSNYLATYPQIQDLEELSIPFIFSNSASHKTVEAYKGPKYMAYGNTKYLEKRNLGIQQLESNGSVATATLDLAIKLGGNLIILLGQDLAYTNMKTHASGARGHKITEMKNMKKVKNQSGEYISTVPNLLNIKHGLEKKIAKHPNINFINCSTGGAYISGCQHYSLDEILGKVSRYTCK
jgi:hypothetical protein